MNRENHICSNGEKCLKNYIYGIVDGIVLKGQEGEGGQAQLGCPPRVSSLCLCTHSLRTCKTYSRPFKTVKRQALKVAINLESCK